VRPTELRGRRWLLAAPILALLFGSSFLAARNLLADPPLLRAAGALAAWNAAPGRPPLAAWSEVHAALLRSAERLPSNPITHELLGLVSLSRADDARHMRESVGHFQAALRLRPHSAHTWAALAQAQYLLGDTGAAFELALVRAAKLGPAEPGVQRVAADYGLATWQHLSAEARAAVERLIAAGVRRDPAEMLQIAHRRGRLGVACRHLRGASRPLDSKVSQLCQGTEALR